MCLESLKAGLIYVFNVQLINILFNIEDGKMWKVMNNRNRQ